MRERAGPSGLTAHLPPFRRRVDSSDEEKPERTVWPPRCPCMELYEGDYEQEEDAEREPPRCRKRVRRCVNPFIDAVAGVDGDASGDEGSDNDNDDDDGFIVADDVVFKIIFHFSEFIKYFIVSLLNFFTIDHCKKVMHSFICISKIQ